MQHPWQPLMQFVTTVDSTMNAARSLAAAGAPHGSSVIAHHQTAGRGRRGRTWCTPAGHHLTLTTVLRPHGHKALHTLSLVAAVAVRRAVMHLGACDVGLKWPNDVWVQGRKLAGLLLEAEGLHTNTPWVLIGIGLNIAPMEGPGVPNEVRHGAIGLMETGVPPPADIETLRMAAAHATIAALHSTYELWRVGGLPALLPEWHSADLLAHTTVRAELDGGWMEGTALGIDADGALRVQAADGLRCVQSGEVQRVRPQKNGP